ncbi:MAG: glycoside hydrolase family 78, partial [Armatimonadota bacterium]|nr:glycoside hydrolase family 78 [Armatimonadota bacterium]
GLVVHRSGNWDWEDWGDNIDSRVLDNAWFCLALEGAANIADLAGHPQDAKAYRAQRESIMQAVNAKFWTGTAYRDPAYKGATDDRANALCVVAGLVSPDKYPAIRAVLAKEKHASPYMEKYVLEALLLMDDPDAALARMKDRYGPAVASPLTTVPENFPLDGSSNHGWSGGPLTILSQYFAGIAPLTPAFSTYQVKPQMGSLHQIHAVVDSVKGKIELSLSRDEHHFTMELTSPPATSALLHIPLAGHTVSRITVNGKAFWADGKVEKEMDGLRFGGITPNEAQFTVAPGKWTIVVEFA